MAYSSLRRAKMALALEGIKVIDLSRTVPGPFCTMMLADMGAEVIKIEDPEYALGMIPDREKHAAHDYLSRNKRSIALNLKTHEAKEIFYKLAGGADVVMEAFRPGVAKRLKVDYETVSKLNPRIIYCSLTGFGQDGPYSDLPGHDPNYTSIGGAVGLTGDHRGNPVIIRATVGDIGSSLHAVIGILFAIIAREKMGKGQFVDISMTDSVLPFLTVSLLRYFRDGFIPRRGWHSLTINVWQCKDGKFITTGLIEPHFWERFCHALGKEDLIPHHHANGEKLREVYSVIRETFLTKTRDEWFQIMKDADTCVSPVLEIDEVVNDPHLLHRGMFPEFDHPTQGKVRQLGMPIKLSETPGKFRNFAPRMGQHTDQILQGLGYSQQQIEELHKSGIIR
jgi:crotonobetainyl-CoA:carnitine CoA-transferase CaiB-like acyl-CoA transferase